MEEEKIHKKTKTSFYGLIFAIGALIFSFLAIIFDPGPVLPPFSKDFYSIDCETINFESYEVINQTLNLTFYTTEPVEYPVSYLPYFIKIYANATQYFFEFSRENTRNISKNGHNINMLIDLPVTGTYQLAFTCLKDPIAYDEVNITNVVPDPTNKTSSCPDPQDDVAVFENVCYDEGRIFFMSRMPGGYYPIHFFNTAVPVEVVPWEFQQYVEFKNISKIEETSFVLSKIETGWWQSILFTLNPLAESIRIHSEMPRYNFYFENTIPKGSTDLLKRFPNKLGVKLTNGSCFKKLVFTGTKTGIDLSQEQLIRKALQKNFTQLRNIFISNIKKDSKRIILPTCLSHLESDITAVCPDCEIYLLGPRLDIISVAEQVSRSKILIGNHLNNLVHAIWMGQNNTAVIDVSPSEDQVCINYAKDFVENLNISYFNVLDDINKNQKCSCTTFSCMKNMPQIEGPINHTRFREVLSQAIQTTML